MSAALVEIRCPTHGASMHHRKPHTKEQAFCGAWWDCEACGFTTLFESPELRAQLAEQARSGIARAEADIRDFEDALSRATGKMRTELKKRIAGRRESIARMQHYVPALCGDQQECWDGECCSADSEAGGQK